MQLSLCATLDLAAAEAAAQSIYDQGSTANTARCRASQLTSLLAWLREAGHSPTTPLTEEVCAQHVGWMVSQGYAQSSVKQRVSTIRALCADRGWPDPTRSPAFAQLIRGVSRTAPRPKGKAPFTAREVRLALAKGEFSARERALLLVGAVTGLRVSNLCALTWGDVEFVDGGALILVSHSKTDQLGKGQRVFLPQTDRQNCPIAALRRLLRVGAMFPVFGLELTDPRKVRQLVKRAAQLVGVNADAISAHSLRVGAATSSFQERVPTEDIQAALWHRKRETTEGYIRVDRVRSNPVFRHLAEELG